MALSPASAIRSIRTAALGALKSGAPSVDGRVFTGTVEPGTPLPYLVIGQYTEDDQGFFGRPGSDVTFRLSGFVPTRDAAGVPIYGDKALLALYGECYATLHRQALPVDGHIALRGSLRYITDYPDPDAAALQFVAEYHGSTRVAGAIA